MRRSRRLLHRQTKIDRRRAWGRARWFVRALIRLCRLPPRPLRVRVDPSLLKRAIEERFGPLGIFVHERFSPDPDTKLWTFVLETGDWRQVAHDFEFTRWAIEDAPEAVLRAASDRCEALLRHRAETVASLSHKREKAAPA